MCLEQSNFFSCKLTFDCFSPSSSGQLLIDDADEIVKSYCEREGESESVRHPIVKLQRRKKISSQWIENEKLNSTYTHI